MKRRAYQQDYRGRIEELLLAYRSNGNCGRYPTIWRLRLLLSSRLWELERDAQIWEDASGHIIAFAMLTKRQRESDAVGLERIVQPEAYTGDLGADMLNWAKERAGELGQGKEEFSIGVCPLAIERDEDVRRLEQAGYRLYEESCNYYMALKLENSVVEVQLPDGFTLKGLHEDEIEAYHALYGFAPTTIAHRRELIHSSEYWHVIAKASDGKFAAYIEYSINRDEWTTCGRCTGWIDYVETAQAYQGHGLARALMLSGLNALKNLGAEEVRLVTASTNKSAQSLYERVGMTLAEKEFVHVATIAPST